MKRSTLCLTVILLATAGLAEMRTWSLQTGETLQGAYERMLFDRVVLLDPAGEEIRIPLGALDEEAQAHLELLNPPDLSVDLLKSADQRFVKSSPIWSDNNPVNILQYTFGARIRKKGSSDYSHPLTVEIYAVAKQIYDPDKYRLILKWTSAPFRLNDSNGDRVEVTAPRTVELSDFLLSGRYPRGQAYAESMLVVRDKRGEVVASNATKNWMEAHLDVIAELPEGAWFDKTGRRVHPTSPKPVW